MDSETQKLVDRVLEANPFEPFDDVVLILKTKLTMTAGGVLLPNNSDERKYGYTVMAIVIAAGPGRFIEATGKRVPLDVKPGDRVLLSVQAGLEFGEVVRKELGAEFSFDELRLVRAHDLMVRVKDLNARPKPGVSD